jgi:hypothetical protein
MTPSMPIATDNIYKFAAIFGLALLIAVALAITYLPDKYGELVFNDNVELEILKSNDDLSTEEIIKKNLLEGKMKLLDDHVTTIIKGSAFFTIIGSFLFLWGGIC